MGIINLERCLLVCFIFYLPLQQNNNKTESKLRNCGFKNRFRGLDLKNNINSCMSPYISLHLCKLNPTLLEMTKSVLWIYSGIHNVCLAITLPGPNSTKYVNENDIIVTEPHLAFRTNLDITSYYQNGDPLLVLSDCVPY